jgi:hypothetical protein
MTGGLRGTKQRLLDSLDTPSAAPMIIGREEIVICKTQEPRYLRTVFGFCGLIVSSFPLARTTSIVFRNIVVDNYG